MKSIIIISTLLLSVYFQNAFGQEEKSIHRKGFIFGTSYGIGYSVLNFPEKKQQEPGFALDLKIGYMINPDLALLLSSNVTVYEYSGFGRDRKRDFGILAPSVQYWVNDKLWILGGAGLGGDNPVFWDIKNPDTDPLETKYYNGLGLITAVGYDIYQRKNFALDLKAKMTYRNVDMEEGNTDGFSFAILLGISFY